MQPFRCVSSLNNLLCFYKAIIHCKMYDKPYLVSYFVQTFGKCISVSVCQPIRLLITTKRL